MSRKQKALSLYNLMAEKQGDGKKDMINVGRLLFDLRESYGISINGWATANERPIRAKSCMKNSKLVRNFLRKSYCFDLKLQLFLLMESFLFQKN